MHALDGRPPSTRPATAAATTARPKPGGPHRPPPPRASAGSPAAPSVADAPPRHAIADGCPPGLNKFSARITQPKAQGASQAMLYATGLTEKDMGKPQVGISSVWYEGNPCNMHLGDLAAEVKAGVEDAGMVGYRFNTIGVSDGISMGTDGMSFSLQSRDLIADSIETVMGAQWYDANVSLPGCDKNMPGTIMAAARLNRPSLMVYGGTIRAGRASGGEPLDIVSAFQSYGELGIFWIFWMEKDTWGATLSNSRRALPAGARGTTGRAGAWGGRGPGQPPAGRRWPAPRGVPFFHKKGVALARPGTPAPARSARPPSPPAPARTPKHTVAADCRVTPKAAGFTPHPGATKMVGACGNGFFSSSDRAPP
jgi:hypothetical protein